MKSLKTGSMVRLKKVDSTNDYLKRNPKLWDKNYFTVYTDHQTGGRGRYNRKWFSQTGKDLAFSFIFLPESRIKHLPCLSLYVGLALSDFLSELIGDSVELKWPNDIQYKGQKLSGILCERMDDPMNEDREVVVVGVGINVNSSSFDSSIHPRPTSLRNMIRQETDIEQILHGALDAIQKTLNSFTVPMRDDVRDRILSVTCSIGLRIKYQDQENRSRVGSIISINHLGELLVKADDGGTHTINNYHDG